LQERGLTLAFAPAAVVWHHLRDSFAGYLSQQRGYGQAEALLEQRWPAKYNPVGQVAWSGRIYSQPQHLAWATTPRIYHGIWGTAAFQPRQARPSFLLSAGATPEWYLILATLAALSFVGLVWRPLLAAIPLFVAASAVAIVSAARGAALARFARTPRSPLARLRKRLLTALLHLEQPAARLEGRLRNGLTPWRGARRFRLALPWPRRAQLWTERRREPSEWLEDLERRLRLRQAVVLRGGPYDRWDLAVRAGACGIVRLRMGVEEHGGGRQLLRFRIWPWLFAARFMSGLFLGAAVLTVAAAFDGAWVATSVLGAATAGMAVRIARQFAAATAAVLDELKAVDDATTVIVEPGARRGSRPERPAPKLSEETGKA
jgi:O-antigen biosynthesis protein